MQYWLMKTEPSDFSWDDLQQQPEQTTYWEGVRNYQARNFMGQMQVGDLILFYHSVVKPQAIMGTAKVRCEAYADRFALDPASKYYDPKSTPVPRWLVVDIQAVEVFAPPITLAELKQVAALAGMMLLQKGCRLSVQPVTAQEWEVICKLRDSS